MTRPPDPDQDRLNAGFKCIALAAAALLIVHFIVGELLQFKAAAARIVAIYADFTAWVITRSVEVGIMVAIVWLVIWLVPTVIGWYRRGSRRHGGAPPP